MNWPHRPVGSLHSLLVHSRRVRMLAGHFADMIPHGHSVLDIGCGDGLLDRLILQRRPDLTVTGVDVMARPGAHLPALLFDGRQLPFPDGSWDTVMFCDVLHHTESPVALLKEAVRVARYSLVIKDHSLEGFLAASTLRLMDFLGNAPHGVVLPYNYLTPRQWQEAFNDCGLIPFEVRRSLRLYPAWAEWIFGRSLHFLGSYAIARGLPS